MNTNAEEPWFETLQGRKSASDRETLEAQGMRQYFETRLDADLVPLNDPARERRLRNLVEAHFATETIGRVSKIPKPMGPLSAWLQSWNLGWSAVGAAAAAVVLGVLIGPTWQGQISADDEWATPKALPSAQPGSASPGGSTPKSFDPNAATNAQEFARKVRSALVPLGIDVRVESAVDGTRVSADIPKELRNAAVQALEPLGLTLPADGRLRVIVR